MWPSQVGDFSASDLQLPEKWRSRLNHPGLSRTRAGTSTAGMDGSNGDMNTSSHFYSAGGGQGGRGRTTDRGYFGELGSSEHRMNGKQQQQQHRQDSQQVPKHWSEGSAQPMVDSALTELRKEVSTEEGKARMVGGGRAAPLQRRGTVIGHISGASVDLEKRSTRSNDAGNYSKADNGASSGATGGINGGTSSSSRHALGGRRGDAAVMNPGCDVDIDLDDSINHDPPRWAFRTVSHESKGESVEGVSCNGNRGKDSQTGSSPDVSPSAAPHSRRQQMLKSRSSKYGSRHNEEGGSGMSNWSTNSPSPVLNSANEVVVDIGRKEA